MRASFLEGNHPIHVAPSTIIAAAEDMFNGDPASDVISLENADGAVFFVINMANAGGNASLWVYACDDTTPTNTTAISFMYRVITGADTYGAITEAKALLTSTGANRLYVIEVDASTLASLGYKYIQLHAVEVTNAAVDGAIAGFLTHLRYQEDDPGTQVT